jgi:hypothetical protein
MEIVILWKLLGNSAPTVYWYEKKNANFAQRNLLENYFSSLGLKLVFVLKESRISYLLRSKYCKSAIINRKCCHNTLFFLIIQAKSKKLLYIRDAAL